MIYYSTQSVTAIAGNESQGIDEAIQRGLDALNAEAGMPVILTDVIPVTMPSGGVYLIILAKPYEPEKQGNLEDLLGHALRVEGDRGIMEKIGEVLLRGAAKIEEVNT